MIVSEFIEWLKTQPQEAVVTCISHRSGVSYSEQGGTIDIVDFSPVSTAPEKYDETFDFIDFSSDYFKDKPYYGRKELFIGKRD